MFDISRFYRGRSRRPAPYYTPEDGALFAADCLDVLPELKAETVDTVFADPPFNLGKEYGKYIGDFLSRPDYLQWSASWMTECSRLLKPGGAFFLYNIPRWCIPLGSIAMNLGLEFRHWIAVQKNVSFPISGRLYPAHYGLLYFTKGKPATFNRIRTPIELCRHCGGEIKDYGGHRRKLNPNGLTLKDIWTDIPTVNHSRYKPRSRTANMLSTKLLDRVVSLSTNPGGVVLDPFGGSGTTYAVCRKLGRQWIGIDIDSADEITKRLEYGTVDHHRNTDFVEGESNEPPRIPEGPRRLPGL